MVVLLLLLLNICVFASDVLDIRVLRVEFKKEDPDNSLTTGNGTFNSDSKDYKLDPKGARDSEAYWLSHIKFAENYFKKASDGKVSINAEVYPKNKKAYKLQKQIIDYNRTSPKKGEKMAEFEAERARDYATFVNDVLTLVKKESPAALAPAANGKRVILIAHAGNSRLVDGGTLGTKGANTPGDFIDAHIDSTWCDEKECFWRGFEVDKMDSIFSVMVSSETASQDGLNWGINGIIVSQIGRELGLPYSYDVVKGYSRLGYFDGMDFAGSNAGNGFFPTLPSAWMRMYKGWATPKEISVGTNKKELIKICAAGYDDCGTTPQIVKIPINNNEYILLENRQRTKDGMVSVNGLKIPVDSLISCPSCKGVIESVDEVDAAIPASGIVAWHVNDWYIKELIPYGAINAWSGDTFKDHQFGIALIEADGVLGLGKEFNSGGESVFYFGSGSDLIPHKNKKQLDTVFSINPSGYANTASTFGGYSGIKITAGIPSEAVAEKTFNAFTGDSVINWRARAIPVGIEIVGKFARPLSKEEWPYVPTNEDFANYKAPGIGSDSMFLGNNRLHIVDANKVPLPNFPVILSNGEPLETFGSKPIPIDLTGKDSLYILIPTNNGLILAVNQKGKLFSEGFPLAAGTFEYDKPDTLLLYIHNNKYLFSKHRDSVSAFYLPEAKKFSPKAKPTTNEEKIEEFFIFPNPVKGGKATARFRILAPAANVSLDIFDITGFKVFSKNISDVNNGSNQIEGLDFSKLGSDVYSVRLSVKFASGRSKEKWFRMAVVK